MQEHRKHPRKRVDRNWEVVDMNREETLGRLVNVSRSGLMLLSLHPLEAGRVVQLRLALAEKADEGGEPVLPGPAVFWAESLWAEPSNEQDRFWVGMQVIDISDENVQALDAILDSFD